MRRFVLLGWINGAKEMLVFGVFFGGGVGGLGFWFLMFRCILCCGVDGWWLKGDYVVLASSCVPLFLNTFFFALVDVSVFLTEWFGSGKGHLSGGMCRQRQDDGCWLQLFSPIRERILMPWCHAYIDVFVLFLDFLLFLYPTLRWFWNTVVAVVLVCLCRGSTRPENLLQATGHWLIWKCLTQWVVAKD